MNVFNVFYVLFKKDVITTGVHDLDVGYLMPTATTFKRNL